MLFLLNFNFFFTIFKKNKWCHFKYPLPCITQNILYAFSKFSRRTTSIIISGS